MIKLMDAKKTTFEPLEGKELKKYGCKISVRDMLPFLSEKEMADKIFVYDSLESTNSTAKEMAISGADHGTIIIADYQTAGRGRYGRKFFSPANHGIYMSIILRPVRQCWPDDPSLMTCYAAVAVCKAIEATTGKVPKIKWVNDILLNQRKICGILTEASTDFKTGDVNWMVVGIGINFSTPAEDFAEDIKNTAGSIFSKEAPTITRNQLIAQIANQILFRGDGHSDESILAEYRKRLMLIGKRVTVIEFNKTYEATVIDVDDTGRLVVENDSGKTLALSAGEINLGK